MWELFSRHKTPQRRRIAKQTQYKPWEPVLNFARQIEASDFMEEMMQRRKARNSSGLMGRMDCAALYGLVRWRRPSIIVESGGYVGMSAAFILKALADEGLTDAHLYSIEFNRECPHGVLIPENLRAAFIPLNSDVRDLVKGDQLPATMDMFMHDSSHRYRHMLWEYKTFWSRLRDGGLLVSHDVHFSAAFPLFVARTYAHDKHGLLDMERTAHYEWGRWGYLGFMIKKEL
jgi:predicted O-methyltransferase YrrM